MTLVEKPCVCVFHTQDGSKGTRQNVGQGRGRRPTWARPGQCRGRGAWVPPRLTAGRSQGLSPRLPWPGDAEEGLACLPPPSGGMGAKQPLLGAGGWRDPRQARPRLQGLQWPPRVDLGLRSWQLSPGNSFPRKPKTFRAALHEK